MKKDRDLSDRKLRKLEEKRARKNGRWTLEILTIVPIAIFLIWAIMARN